MKRSRRQHANRAVRCSTKRIHVAFVTFGILALCCQIALWTFDNDHSHWDSLSERRRRAFAAFLRPHRRLLFGEDDDDDDDAVSMSPSGMATSTPSLAPSSAPSIERNTVQGGDISLEEDSSSNNTGVIVGSVVGALVVGLLLLAAIVYVRHDTPDPVPLHADAAPLFSDNARDEIVPAARVLPSAPAVTDTVHRALYKDDPCVAEPFASPSGPTAALPSDILARETELEDRGDLPFAMSVATALSAHRPLLEP